MTACWCCRTAAAPVRPHELPAAAEYRGLYPRFAALVRSGTSDVDLNPLIHVADAFLRGERLTVESFTD